MTPAPRSAPGADGSLYASDYQKAAALAERATAIEDELLQALERWEALGGSAGLACGGAFGVAGGGLGFGIDLLAQLLAGRHQRGRLAGDGVLVVALEGRFQIGGGFLNGLLVGGVEFVAMLGQGLAHAMQRGFALIFGL